MYEPWIFATTLAAGGSLFAYSVALQPQRNDAPITPEPPPAAVHVIPPAPPTPVAEPQENPVLELEPVVIQARIHRRAATPPPTTEPEQRPCSDWRSLGPAHVAAGTKTGEVAVRSLCQ
jgi:hypothetical protein